MARVATAICTVSSLASVSSANAGAMSAPTWPADRQPFAATSIDATRLVYSAWDPFNTTVHIFTSRKDGSRMRRLTSAPQVRDLEPVWSPDGTRMAFNRSFSPQPAGPGIFVMAADGTHRRRVVSGIFDLGAWSPTGTKLLATADGALPHQLVIVRLNGLTRTVKVVEPDPRGDAWSPHADVIVYSAGTTRKLTSYNLYGVHADGTPTIRLTHDQGVDDDASFSPAGHRIVYTHTNATSRFSHVFIMNADGTATRQVTSGKLAASSPHFTCDGHWIVFSIGAKPSALRAYAVRPDGTQMHPLDAAIRPLTSDPRPVC